MSRDAHHRYAGPDELGLHPSLVDAGFNRVGVLRAADYDALVPLPWRSQSLLPHSRSVIVLGCGGRAFGDAFLRCREANAKNLSDPVDRFTARVAQEASSQLTRRGVSTRALFYWERRDKQFADFVALGRACGLGWPSRLGMLLHPEFGPWISLRALLLTQLELAPSGPLAEPAPCTGCPAPCADGCRGDAIAADGFDIVACSRTTQREAACRERCDARRACVIGKQHAYAPRMERIFRSTVVEYLSPPKETR